MDRYDVVIVGARCAGSPLATILAQRGLRVCLLDKATFPSETPSTSAFQSNGVDVLRRIGVLDEILAAGAYVVDKATVTSTRQKFVVDIDPEVYGQTIGMRRTTLDKILVDFAAAAGVEVRTNCPVSDVLTDGGRVIGVMTRSGPVYAELVIGADGRQSTVAKSLGAEEYCTRPPGRLPTWAFYEGVAPDVGFYFGTVKRPQGGTTGYLGIPLDGCFLVSVNVPMDQSSRFLEDRYSNFDSELARFPELADIVEGATRVGPLRVLQKWHGYFRRSAGPGWALVGDAGHFKDYSLGQGQSDAFRQAEYLAERIVSGFDHQGLDEELLSWWRWRDTDAWQMYWANCLLGEAYLPSSMADAMFGLAARDPAMAEQFSYIFNKKVAPLQIASPPTLAKLGPQVLWNVIAEARRDRLQGLRALGAFALFSARFLRDHPRSVLGTRRYRFAPIESLADVSQRRGRSRQG